MSKKPTTKKRITNRRAVFDYALSDSYIVGLVLSGAETKSLRLGHGQLQGAYVTVKNDELWLINALINGAPGVVISDNEKTQSRKLLAHQKEIDQLITAKQQGYTIIPVEILTSGRYIKLRIAVGRGKKKYDKRQIMKTRDENRNIDAALKQQGRN